MTYTYEYFGSAEEREGKKRLYYACSIKNLVAYTRQEITLTKAKHIAGKNKNQVRAVVISNSNTWCMPSNLADHFQFLVAINLSGCDLREISERDMQPFTMLIELFLSNNRIEILPADLFRNNVCLKILSFRHNRIRLISEQTLEPLKNLMFADFRDNTNINMVYSSGKSSDDASVSLSILKANIYLHCKPPHEQSTSTVTSYVNSLWKGEFSDFKIRSGKDVFSVHKAVLAVNSPVFAAMFSHDMKENIKNEVTIENVFPETIKELLEYVYLRKVATKCAVDLYVMAETYQMKELAAVVQWLVVTEINAENASSIYEVGAIHNNKIIKEAAFEEIEKYFDKDLPRGLIDSLENMTKLLEAKKELDRVLEEITQLYAPAPVVTTQSYSAIASPIDTDDTINDIINDIINDAINNTTTQV